MSSSSRSTEGLVTVSPHYVNKHYLQHVGVVSTLESNYGHQQAHETLNEAQLIERAKLTLSEKEVNKLRLSGNFGEGDNLTYQKSEVSHESAEQESGDGGGWIEVSRQQDTEDGVFNVDPDTDDTEMFYETQTDETTLIRYAKLADDGLAEAAKCSGSLIRDDIHIGDEETKLRLETTDENADGFQTPVNSEAGDAATDEIKTQPEVCFHLLGKLNTSKSKTADDTKQLVPHDRVSAENVDERNKRVVHLRAKTDDFKGPDDDPIDPDFRKLVVSVVEHLQDCDLDEILSMFAGSGILEMTGIVPPAQLMTILQKHRLISRDNLHHLQGLIMRLDDIELYTKAVQYIRHHHDVVFFYPDQDLPTKGFGKIQCFINGRDFTRLTREDLELVRFKVASLVFLPVHYVYIVGIEPGQRTVVTLMLLERYVQELSEMAREGLTELSLANVDAIRIFGKTYSTAGTTAIEKYRDSGHTSFLSVYQQLWDKTKQVEKRDAEVTKLREEVEFMQLQLETMGAELEMLTEKALSETVTKRRFGNSRINKHPRTRSFPSSYREEADDRKFALALEWAVSPVIPEPEPCFVFNNTVALAHNAHTTDNNTHGGHMEDLVLRSAARKYENIQQTDCLMDEIEAILSELACSNF